MITLREAVRSSLGRKWLTSLTGIGLGLFVIIHLAGNLMLYPSDGSMFNEYALGMEKKKAFLLVAELGLIGVFLVHVVNSISLKIGHRKARGSEGYRQWASKANSSMETPSSWASRMMAVSGLTLLIFIPLHVWQIKFGPGIQEGYYTLVNGEEARDLHRWVVEVFQQPLYVVLYVFAMFALGGHLKHGYWSFFQSLGLVTPRNHRGFQIAGAGLALLLAIGFLMIPVYIYMRSHGGAA